MSISVGPSAAAAAGYAGNAYGAAGAAPKSAPPTDSTDTSSSSSTNVRKTGQQVDFTEFDNRSLAIVALNADASFSGEEASAAKAELNQRTRSGVLNAFDPDSGGGLKPSTDEFANRIMQNYRAMSSLQNSIGSGAGLTAYF